MIIQGAVEHVFLLSLLSTYASISLVLLLLLLLLSSSASTRRAGELVEPEEKGKV